MSELATLKIRMPQERYLALMHMAHQHERSVNGEINHLVSVALSQLLDEIKSQHRGCEGDTDENA